MEKAFRQAGGHKPFRIPSRAISLVVRVEGEAKVMEFSHESDPRGPEEYGVG